jgi:ascorbate-specific PTS system EIIC-type component UlaA
MIRLLIVLIMLSLSSGCWRAATAVATSAGNDVAKEAEKLVNKKIDDIVVGKIEVKEGESKLDALLRERSEVVGKLAAAKASLDAQIMEARAEAIKIKCYYTAGIAGVISLLLIIAAVLLRNIPGLRGILGTGAAIFLSIAVLALGVSWLVDYLKYIIVGAGVLIAVVVLPNIQRIYSALRGVVGGFEVLKNSIPEYKDTMRQHVGTLDDVVNTVREQLKAEINKKN